MTIAPAPSAPPSCPNPHCTHHGRPKGWRYQRDGFHSRLALPHRVQRFRCCHCRRRFSHQTFSTDYWLRRPELLEPIFLGLVAGSCLRQLARSLGASPQTILLHANRLGRACELFHAQHRPRGPITESVALDGFVSFEFSQYHPTSYHLLVGRGSRFLYGFTVSEQRRSGRMTARQKQRRREIEKQFGKPDPRAVMMDVAELLRIACPEPQKLELHSDEHQEYPRAIQLVPHLEVDHRTVSSQASRTTANPLFTINLIDLMIRHSGANHKRETIAFPKRRQMAIWRLWIFATWWNFIKWTSERRHQQTPAMKLGIAERQYTVKDILKTRLFPTLVRLPERWSQYYWGQVTTREIPNGRQHHLKYAF